MAGRLQLRMYTINKGKLSEFLDAWRKGVVPLRAKYGFRIEGGWAVENENRFYWLMAYDDEDWDTAEQAYYNSPERKTLTPDPSQFVAHMEVRFVHFESSNLS